MPPFYDSPARQADRLGRERGAAALARLRARARRAHHRGRADDARRCIWRSLDDARCRAAPSIRAGSRIGWPFGACRRLNRARLSGAGGEAVAMERTLFLRRRRAHLRRDRRGNVARGFLQVAVDHQRGARRAASRASRKSARPTPRFQIRFDPDVISPNDMLAELKRLESAAAKADPHAYDAHHRDPGLLQRSLDARDADALPRAPSGPDRRPTSNMPRAINGYRWRRRLHRGAFRRALVRLDGRLRRRAAVPVPDGRAREADRGPEISAPAHRHAEAHGRPWRLLRLHLFGARRWRLSDVRHHADADLRSQPEDRPISATS